MIRTLLFIATVPVVFWLATCAVLPDTHYSKAEPVAQSTEPIEWRHTVDGWEPIDRLQVESPPSVQQPPIHPLTLLPLVVAIALAGLLAFEPQEDLPVTEMAQPTPAKTAVKAKSHTPSSTPV